MLNYFNGDGVGGGFPTSRGADTPSEFTRQRDKTIAAIVAIDADVVGLMEIENDYDDGSLSAIADLVDIEGGIRESDKSWTEVLVDLKRRGLDMSPEPAVGDGAMGQLLESNLQEVRRQTPVKMPGAQNQQRLEQIAEESSAQSIG